MQETDADRGDAEKQFILDTDEDECEMLELATMEPVAQDVVAVKTGIRKLLDKQESIMTYEAFMKCLRLKT